MIIKVKFLEKLNLLGIALFPFLLVADKNDEGLIRHERIHFRQQAETLVVFFYLLYGIFYLIGRAQGLNHDAAYRNIPFEREAYRHENEPGYLKKRRLFAWAREA